jgi:hypothetical protein
VIVKIKNEPPSEPTVELSLQQDEQDVNLEAVTNDNEWIIGCLREDGDGRLILHLFDGISDELIATDEKGRIIVRCG